MRHIHVHRSESVTSVKEDVPMHVVQQHLVLEDGLTHSEHDLVNRMYETNTGEIGAIANVLADQQGEPYATAITSDAVVKQVPIGRMVYIYI